MEELARSVEANKELSQTLRIVEGLTTHGTDCDLEITLFTTDGIASVYRWIRQELAAKYPFITAMNTVTISYSHRWRSYAGADLREFPKAPGH